MKYFDYEVTEDGRVFNKFGKQLNDFCNGKGYRILQLREAGKSVNRAVHKIVAGLYVPNPDNLPEVGHDDGDKANNHHTNLIWCTRSQNIQHAYDNALRSAKGEKNARALLSEKDVVIICELLLSGMSCQKVHEATMFPYQAIRNIRSRRNWIYISSKYKW